MLAIVSCLRLLAVVSAATTVTVVQGQCLSKNFTDANEFSKNLVKCAYPIDTLNLKCVAKCTYLRAKKACPWSKDFVVNEKGLKKALKRINDCLFIKAEVCETDLSKNLLPAMGLQQDLGDFSYDCYSKGRPKDKIRGLLNSRIYPFHNAEINATHITLPFGLFYPHQAITYYSSPDCVFRGKDGQVVGQDHYAVYYGARFEAEAAIAYTQTTPSATVTSATKSGQYFAIDPVKDKHIVEPNTELKYFQGLEVSLKAIAYGADDAMPYANFFATYIALALQVLRDNNCPK